MNKLPNPVVTIGNTDGPTNSPVFETVVTKMAASEELENILNRSNELEEIFVALQPLLYKLSVKLYGEDDKPVSLTTLIEDACKMLGD